MRVPINWIKEFVDLTGIDARELTQRLTLGTCEVDKLERVKSIWLETFIVEIRLVQPHPNADNLYLVRFNSGKEEQQLVCGANNLEVGMRAVWAPVGTKIAPDFILTAKKIRGIISNGMLCSERELVLGDDHDGILRLSEQAEVGSSLAQYLLLADEQILNIDNKSLTHRPDLWGIYGMARECAALFKRKLVPRFNSEWQQRIRTRLQSTTPSPIKLSSQGESALIAYGGLSISGVTVQSSPQWLKSRLFSAGLQPINNLVDISNYVMLELGQPNHFFDVDKLSGDNLKIYRLDQACEFITLDQHPRQLLSGDTVIADAAGVQVLAGIMGGLDSSISSNTKRIFIEAACWQASAIRRSSVRLGLRSDSSLRYEKSLDPQQLELAILRLAELVLELCPQAEVVGKIEWARPMPLWQAPQITLSADKVERVLGCSLPIEKMVDILRSLAFQVELEGRLLRVQVPSFRATRDINIDVDLIEEIGRILGYDNIPPQAPQVSLQYHSQPPSRLQEWQMRQYLVQHGKMQESFSYPLLGADLLQQCQWPDDNKPLKLVNPMSAQMDRMRPSLVPSALATVAFNLANYPFPRYRIFEIGRSYLPQPQHFAYERYQLMLLCYDNSQSPFVELRELVEGLLQQLNYPINITSELPIGGFPPAWPGLHTYEQLTLVDNDGLAYGGLASIHPQLLNGMRIRGRVAIAILDYSELRQQHWPSRMQFRPPSRFPASQFDCSLKISKKIPVEQLLRPLQQLDEPLLREVKIVTIYPLDEQYHSVTLRSTFQANNATLNPQQLEQLQNKVVIALATAGFPLKLETHSQR